MLNQLDLFPPDPALPLRRRVTVQLVKLAEVRAILEQFHYLKRARVGRQLNYAVSLDGVVDGVITYAYPMMSVPLLDTPADELLEFARMFLARNVPHVASCAIGQTLRRVRQDWAKLFPDAKPVRLVVSWSDTVYHQGTIYKAANFEWVKRSKGHPPGNLATSKRGVRESHSDYSHDKDCWVFRWPKELR